MKKRVIAILLIAVMLVLACSSLVLAADKGTGLYKEDGQWKYFENGSFKEVSGLVQRPDNNTWHYVESGIYKKVTGLVQCVQPGSSKGKWYYVVKGDLDKTTVGLVKCVQPGSSNGKWYYVENGKQKNGTGLVQCIQPGVSKGKWYYVSNGKLNNNKTGLVECIQPGTSEGKIYYVKNGKLLVKTGAISEGYVNINLKNGRFTSYSVNPNVTFPSLSSLGLKGYGSTLDAKLDKKLKEIIDMHCKEGLNFNDVPDLYVARNIIMYVNVAYPYVDQGSYSAESMLDKGYGNCFAYSDLVLCALKKMGFTDSWLTVVGRYPNKSMHRSTVYKIDGKYYMADTFELESEEKWAIEEISFYGRWVPAEMTEEWAKYLTGKSNVKPKSSI